MPWRDCGTGTRPTAQIAPVPGPATAVIFPVVSPCGLCPQIDRRLDVPSVVRNRVGNNGQLRAGCRPLSPPKPMVPLAAKV